LPRRDEQGYHIARLDARPGCGGLVEHGTRWRGVRGLHDERRRRDLAEHAPRLRPPDAREVRRRALVEGRDGRTGIRLAGRLGRWFGRWLLTALIALVALVVAIALGRARRGGGGGSGRDGRGGGRRRRALDAVAAAEAGQDEHREERQHADDARRGDDGEVH